jgi:tetratricopeptide (TPR) repeat protein
MMRFVVKFVSKTSKTKFLMGRKYFRLLAELEEGDHCFKEAAECYELCKDFKKAAECFILVKEFKSAGGAYSTIEEHYLAGVNYRKAESWHEAAVSFGECLKLPFANDAIKKQENLKSAIDCCFVILDDVLACKIIKESSCDKKRKQVLVQEIYKRWAEHYHSIGLANIMMRSVRKFGTKSSKRKFLMDRKYYRELAELEKEDRCFKEAAECYVLCKDFKKAANLFYSTGDFLRAVDCYVKAGMYIQSAQCLVRMVRLELYREDFIINSAPNGRQLKLLDRAYQILDSKNLIDTVDADEVLTEMRILRDLRALNTDQAMQILSNEAFTIRLALLAYRTYAGIMFPHSGVNPDVNGRTLVNFVVQFEELIGKVNRVLKKARSKSGRNALSLSESGILKDVIGFMEAATVVNRDQYVIQLHPSTASILTKNTLIKPREPLTYEHFCNQCLRFLNSSLLSVKLKLLMYLKELLTKSVPSETMVSIKSSICKLLPTIEGAVEGFDLQQICASIANDLLPVLPLSVEVEHLAAQRRNDEIRKIADDLFAVTTSHTTLGSDLLRLELSTAIDMKATAHLVVAYALEAQFAEPDSQITDRDSSSCYFFSSLQYGALYLESYANVLPLMLGQSLYKPISPCLFLALCEKYVLLSIFYGRRCKELIAPHSVVSDVLCRKNSAYANLLKRFCLQPDSFHPGWRSCYLNAIKVANALFNVLNTDLHEWFARSSP